MEARIEELQAELAELRQRTDEERAELAALLEKTEADLRAILWSRRYRFANVLSTLAHRVVPAFGWELIGQTLRRVHPLLVRLKVSSIHPETPDSLAALSAKLGGSTGPLPADVVPLGELLDQRVTVVVPVFDAFEETRTCLDSLTRYLGEGAELLVIDDGSRDPRIHTLLEEVQRLARVRVERNPENLGFTRTVNRALELTEGDVVLLNSDAEVGPRFIEGLVEVAYSEDRVASVTAVSNAAGAFSVPRAEEDNPLPDGWTVADVARRLSQAEHAGAVPTPTGNGFCMYLRRDALREVGPFDADLFPRGYGEENEWSLRAASAGWHHRIAPRVWVRHEGSASFGAERAELARQGRDQIDEAYPDYGERLREFQRSPELGHMRTATRQLLESEAAGQGPVRPRVLRLILGGGGGMEYSCSKLMRATEDQLESFLLTSDTHELKLYQHKAGELRLRERLRLESPLTAEVFTSQEYSAFLSGCLQRYAIELVHIHHLAGHGLDAVHVARAHWLPVVMTVHDFYPVCPTANLLDERDRYCGGSCTEGAGRCRIPTRWSGAMPPLKHEFIHQWREAVEARIVRQVSALVAPTASAGRVLASAYPEAADLVRVIPHGFDAPSHSLAGEPRPSEPLKVLVLGELTPAKGGEFLRQLVQLAGPDELEVHLLGPVNSEYSGIGVEHGRYDQAELMDRITEIRPAVVGLFSIWAETYSNTLTEAWLAGVPVVAPRLGAFEERIEATGAGWLFEPGKPAVALECLRRVRQDEGDWAARRECAERASPSSLAEMAGLHLELYRELWSRHRGLRPIDAARA